MANETVKRLLEQQRAGEVLTTGELDIIHLDSMLDPTNVDEHNLLGVLLRFHVAKKEMNVLLAALAEKHGVEYTPV